MIKFNKSFYSTITIVYLLLSSTFSYAKNDRLVITGSSTVAPLILEIGKRFEKLNSGVRIDVQTGGSSRGIADARSGLADIGMASRALTNSENDVYSHTIALDGIAVIVNSKNAISQLTDEEVKNIFIGEIKNWKQVNGVDKPITVVNKAEGRSTLELFLQHYQIKNSDIKASIIIGDNQQGIKTVVGNPYAIGYVSIGAAEFEAKYGTPIKLLPMNNVPASISQIQNGNFPLSRPLNLITHTQETTGLVKKFIEFAQSKEAHDLIDEQYFVPVTGKGK